MQWSLPVVVLRFHNGGEFREDVPRDLRVPQATSLFIIESYNI